MGKNLLDQVNNFDKMQWFRCLLHGLDRNGVPETSNDDKEDKYWINIKKYKASICINLINVPPKDDWQQDDHQLALGIMKLFYNLELLDANIVYRSPLSLEQE